MLSSKGSTGSLCPPSPCLETLSQLRVASRGKPGRRPSILQCTEGAVTLRPAGFQGTGTVLLQHPRQVGDKDRSCCLSIQSTQSSSVKVPLKKVTFCGSTVIPLGSFLPPPAFVLCSLPGRKPGSPGPQSVSSAAATKHHRPFATLTTLGTQVQGQGTLRPLLSVHSPCATSCGSPGR